VQRDLVRKTEEKGHLVGRGVDVRIILRCILRKWDLGLWTTSS